MGRRSRSESNNASAAPAASSVTSASSSQQSQDGCDQQQSNGATGHDMMALDGTTNGVVEMDDVEFLDGEQEEDEEDDVAIQEEGGTATAPRDMSQFTFHWGDHLINGSTPPASSQQQAASALAVVPRMLNPKQRGIFLHLERDLLTVSYHGPGNQIADVGSIQADAAFSGQSGKIVSYFEITVRGTGKKNKITIGLTVKDYVLSRLPGWERGSYGYHANGKIVNNLTGGQNVDAKTYGPQFDVGDVIGCGMVHSRKEIFFTHNGTYLGIAFSNVVPAALFPTIGLHSQGERVTANFGVSAPTPEGENTPVVASSSTNARTGFKFDIDTMIDDERNRILSAEVLPLSLPVSDVHALVCSHLLYSGYKDTLLALLEANSKRQDSLNSFTDDVLIPTASEYNSSNSQQNGAASTNGVLANRTALSPDKEQSLMSTISDRKRLTQYVISGEALLAIREGEKLYPGLFCGARSSDAATTPLTGSKMLFSSRKEALRIRLYCVHLVELVRHRKVDEALHFSRQHFADIVSDRKSPNTSKSAEIEQLVTDCVGLLAYENPYQTTNSWLLRRGFRQSVADELNRCILEYTNQDRLSSLERVLAHLVASKRCLREQIAFQEEQYWQQHYAVDK